MEAEAVMAEAAPEVEQPVTEVPVAEQAAAEVLAKQPAMDTVNRENIKAVYIDFLAFRHIKLIALCFPDAVCLHLCSHRIDINGRFHHITDIFFHGAVVVSLHKLIRLFLAKSIAVLKLCILPGLQYPYVLQRVK